MNVRTTWPPLSRISSVSFCAGFFSQYVICAGRADRMASPGLNRYASVAVVAADPYELRIVLPAGIKSDKPVAAEVAAEDRVAGVVASVKEEPGAVRVTLNAPAGGSVRWKVRF